MLLNVLDTGKYVVKIWLPLWLTGCVRFAWNFGELHNRHLYSDGELHFTSSITITNYATVFIKPADSRVAPSLRIDRVLRIIRKGNT